MIADHEAEKPNSITLALTLAGVLAVGHIVGLLVNYHCLEKDLMYCQQSGAYSILIAPETHQPCLIVEQEYQTLRNNSLIQLLH